MAKQLHPLKKESLFNPKTEGADFNKEEKEESVNVHHCHEKCYEILS